MHRPTLPPHVSRFPHSRARRRQPRPGAALRLASLLRYLPCAVAFKGTDGQVVQLNPRAEGLVGRWIEATPRTSAPLLFPPEEARRCRDEDEAGLARGLTFRREDTLLFPDGTTRTLRVRKFPVQGKDGRIQGLGVVALDLPEAGEAAAEVPPRHRLEAMGLLAGGLAHDFNNLLTAAFGNLERLQLELGMDTRASPFLENLEALATRGAVLVDQLLACTGHGLTQMQALDLNRLVEETLGVLRASLSLRASLRWNPAPDLPPLHGDPRQIRRVVTNLVLNAAEAMDPRGGTVTLGTGLRILGPEDPDASGPAPELRAGPHLVLEVTDSGSGMAPEVRDRLFEPFFTTKEVGRGLGLSAVQEVLRAHGGSLHIQTESGQGTRVEVLLPASSGTSPECPEELPPSSPPPALLAQGTILVVDDESLVRSVAAGALRRMGFETLEAAGGREAVALAQANRDRIRLILMDFIMPELDGMEAYRELRRLGLRTPVVLSSGFGRGEARYHLQGKGLAGFLPKPYRFRLLSEVVMRALARELPSEASLAPASGRDHPVFPDIVWGVQALSEGQQALFQAYGDLARAADTRETGAVERGWQAFLARFEDQARREEAWMDHTAYPGGTSHRESHARILTHLQALGKDLEAGGFHLAPAILDFIEGLVFCHEEHEDLDFARFLG